MHAKRGLPILGGLHAGWGCMQGENGGLKSGEHICKGHVAAQLEPKLAHMLVQGLDPSPLHGRNCT